MQGNTPVGISAENAALAYVGRLAPTPTGYLHAGHARTFHQAWQRARTAGGHLILRIEDLDESRCKPEYVDAVFEDLRWLGIDWDGEVVFQSRRKSAYRTAWRRLLERGWIYPCPRSRKDLGTLAPHAEEPVFPSAWRSPVPRPDCYAGPEGTNWRFQVPDGVNVVFEDALKGRIQKTAGLDFGDFLVWNREGVPSYELAVVVDDHAMGITEVVRGEDLLTSTARQILLAQALGFNSPRWCHTPLVCDAHGRRLAKRSGSLSIRTLRSRGASPADVLGIVTG
jgi:glutamyl-tRNA synthetase